METRFLGSREIPRTPLESFIWYSGRVYHTIWWWIFSLTLSKKVKKDFEKLIKILDTPEKVQSYLWANIKYRKDTKPWHHWQPAEITFREKAGDCEDWAIFANACLREKYECYFLCMYTKKSGHATYLIKEGGEKWISVGTFGLHSHSGKIPEIIPDWGSFKDWTMATLMDENIDVIEVYHQ